MGTTAADLRPGDVLRYDSADGTHCREGIAVAHEVRGTLMLLDTYWACSGADLTGTERWTFWSDAHRLTPTEQATAEHQFNLGDFRPAERNEDVGAYDSSSVVCVSAQHNLTRHYFVRPDAKRSDSAILERQRNVVERARRELLAAQQHLDQERVELRRLLVLRDKGESL